MPREEGPSRPVLASHVYADTPVGHPDADRKREQRMQIAPQPNPQPKAKIMSKMGPQSASRPMATISQKSSIH